MYSLANCKHFADAAEKTARPIPDGSEPPVSLPHPIFTEANGEGSYVIASQVLGTK